LFIDGNKRVGANAAITFLPMNNWEPTFDEEQFVELVLSVASGGLRKARLVEIFENPLYRLCFGCRSRHCYFDTARPST
jgi:prophage maintenance system killer protein